MVIVGAEQGGWEEGVREQVAAFLREHGGPNGEMARLVTMSGANVSDRQIAIEYGSQGSMGRWEPSGELSVIGGIFENDEVAYALIESVLLEVNSIEGEVGGVDPPMLGDGQEE